MGRMVQKSGPSIKALSVALDALDGVSAKVGWLDGNNYSDGTPVAYVAVIHEFGAPAAGIPARPVLRPAVARFQSAWMGLVEKGAVAVLEGRTTGADVLGLIAMQAAGDLAKQYQTPGGPALQPETVARKGFDTKLVDSGILTQTIQHQVSTS